MPILINPLSIQDAEQRRLLRALLEENRLCIQWLKDKVFTVLGQPIQLTHTILLAAPQEGLLSYRVIADKVLGDGAASVVYPVECTLSFPNEHEIQYHQLNTLVVKIQSFKLTPELTTERIKAMYKKEFAFASLTQHLGMERPYLALQSKSKAPTPLAKIVMFMNKMPGVELLDIIKIHDYRYVSSKMLISLTCAILTTYKQQVLDRHIMMHGDIKPENIMVDIGLAQSELLNITAPNFSPERLKINIIDYAFCLKQGWFDTLPGQQGTPEYMAPEIVSIDSPTTFCDEKPDIYSLGICLEQLWFGQHPLSAQTDRDYDAHMQTIYERSFWREVGGFSTEDLCGIHDAIVNMTHQDPNQRWSLTQSIAVFDQISSAQMAAHRLRLAARRSPSLFRFFQAERLTPIEGALEDLAFNELSLDGIETATAISP